MSNPFSNLMGVSDPDMAEVGAPITILGDPAAAVAEVDRPAKFLTGNYTIQDRIDIGLGNNAVLAAGATATYACSVSSPFKPESLTIPSWLAPDVSVMDVKIGSDLYVESNPVSGVPGDQFSEVSVTRKVSWGTVQTNVPIQITLRNDTALPVNVKMAIRGLRLK